MLKRAIYERVVRLADGVSFDFKELITDARWVEAAGRRLWALVRALQPQILIGPGFGGIPLLYAVAMAARQADDVDLALWMVRDQRKTYYRKRWIEGPACPPGARAVIVDDFLGRGTAVSLVDEALLAEQREVTLCGVAVLFDHWNPLGARQLSVSRFPVVSVFKRHDIGLTRDCFDAAPPMMRGAAPPLVERPLWWRFDLNGSTPYPYKSAPVVADDAVFAADDKSQVWRFDADSGEALWCRRSLGQPFKGIVQRLQWVDGSLVYGCYDGTVTRLDGRTGEIIWRWRPDSHVHATPAVDLRNNRLFINTEQENDGEPFGHLYSLDWATGKVLWRYRHAFWPPSTPVYAEDFDLVVAACNDQSLVGVCARTGELRWRGETRGLVRGAPALCGARVVVATEAGYLQSFDLRTGAEVCVRRHGPGATQQIPYVADGLVYAMDDIGHLVAFDADDFRIRWMGRLRSPGACTPVPLGRHLVVLSREGHLAAFEPARERKVWEGQVGGDYFQAPAIGTVHGRPILVCASHHAGLKAFAINPYYIA